MHRQLRISKVFIRKLPSTIIIRKLSIHETDLFRIQELWKKLNLYPERLPEYDISLMSRPNQKAEKQIMPELQEIVI